MQSGPSVVFILKSRTDMLGGAALPSTTQVGFSFLSYVSDLVIPSTRHFLGSHSVGTSQASANSHRFHSLIWRVHKGIYSPWETSDIAIGCERRWEDGWRGWWTQGLTGASRGGNRAWCNSTSMSLFCLLGLWFLQYVAILCSLKCQWLISRRFSWAQSWAIAPWAV